MLILSSGENIPFEIRTRLTQKYPEYQVPCAKEYIDQRGSRYFFILKNQQGDRINGLNVESNGRGGLITLQQLSRHA